MPNMSRRSLENHQNRTNETSSNNATHESFLRSRFHSNSERFQNLSTADYSQDELDADEFDYRTTAIYRKSEQKASIIRRFFTSIVTIIVTIFSKTRRVFSSEGDYHNVRYTNVNDVGTRSGSGFVSKVTSAFSAMFASIFRYIYIAIASIQFWDSCLLQSSNTQSRGKKRFLLFLLLLLLAGELKSFVELAGSPK